MCYMDSEVACLVSDDMVHHQQNQAYCLMDPDVHNTNPLGDLLVDQGCCDVFLDQMVVPSSTPPSFMFESDSTLDDLMGGCSPHNTLKPHHVQPQQVQRGGDMLAFLPSLRSSSSPAASSSTGYAFSDDTTSVTSLLQLHQHHQQQQPKLEDWGATPTTTTTTGTSGAPFSSYHDSTIVNCSSNKSTTASTTSSSTMATMATMRESLYRMAIWRPVLSPLDSTMLAGSKPKRRNVRISKDPQTVAARHRRERISTKIRILQRLVPGGTKMDTASMLDEAIHYVKYLKSQVRAMELLEQSGGGGGAGADHHSAASGMCQLTSHHQHQQQNLSTITTTAAGGSGTTVTGTSSTSNAVASAATGGFFWPAHQQFPMDNNILGFQQVGY